MDPIEKPVNQEPDEQIRPFQRPVMADVAIDQVEPVSAPNAGRNRLFLFQYVTMLVSGLVLLSLVSLAGYSLLDHWLGQTDKASAFNDFFYSFHLYLIVSLVLFGGLHLWMRLLTRGTDQNEQSSSTGVFLAIFLTILALTAASAFGAIVYLVVDTLLGTGNYTVKGSWLIILGALQMIVWSGLLWWYFKRPKSKNTVAMLYAGIAGLVCVAVIILLIVFPVLAKRDAVIDSRTTTDLSAISSAVSEYAQKNNKLPGNLRDLTLDETVVSRLGSYEYEVKQTPASTSMSEEDYFTSRSSDVFSYKLCANFKTDTAKDDKDKSIIPLLYSPSELSRHPSGRHCFDQTAYGGGDDLSKSSRSLLDDTTSLRSETSY